MEPGNLDQFWHLPLLISGVDFKEKIINFQDMSLSPLILRNVMDKYERPLPIQQGAIPNILNGRDLMGHSRTGSGKTAAYAIPLMELMLRREFIMPAGSNRSGSVKSGETIKPKALVLLPTRELALQVMQELIRFAVGTDANIQVIIGGRIRRYQWANVRKACDILVATPLRLWDFIDEDKISMEDCHYLILDEADRMLDMGFEPQVRKIVERGNMMPKGTNRRQSMLFSATYSDAVQELCNDFLFNPIKITIGEIGAANTDIIQEFIKLATSEKYAHLRVVLDELKAEAENGSMKVLVFVKRKVDAQDLADDLEIAGYDVSSYHGNLNQKQRERALNKFKAGQCSILVATSIAARGLDIPKIDMVINFDLPTRMDVYVQRIGRTGRIGNKGRAMAFYDSGKDRKLARPLVKILAKAGRENPDQTTPPWLLEEAGIIRGARYFHSRSPSMTTRHR